MCLQSRNMREIKYGPKFAQIKHMNFIDNLNFDMIYF